MLETKFNRKRKRYGANTIKRQVDLRLDKELLDSLEYIQRVHNFDFNQLCQTALVHFLKCPDVKKVFRIIDFQET